MCTNLSPLFFIFSLFTLTKTHFLPKQAHTPKTSGWHSADRNGYGPESEQESEGEDVKSNPVAQGIKRRETALATQAAQKRQDDRGAVQISALVIRQMGLDRESLIADCGVGSDIDYGTPFRAG